MKIVSIGGNDGSKFDDLVTEEQAFVKFYHPSCGHCVAMAPEWKKLGERLKDKNYDLNIIEVHADAIPNIKSECATNIQGYPTIKGVEVGGLNGKEYNGSRDSNEMIKFIMEELIDNKSPIVKKKRHRRRKHTRKGTSHRRGRSRKRHSRKRRSRRRYSRK